MKQWAGTVGSATVENIVPDSWRANYIISFPVVPDRTPTFVLDNIGYACGSTTVGKERNVYSYSLLENSVKIKGSLSASRLGGIGASLYGFGYCGFDTTPVATWEKYSPSLDSWSLKTSAGTARYGAVSFSIANRIYVYSGTTTGVDTGGVNTIEYYEPFSDSWTTKTAGGTAKNRSGAFFLADLGDACGGTSTAGAGLTTHDQYNSSTDAWTAKAVLPAAKAKAIGATANNSGYILADTFYKYNYSSNAFSTLAAPTTTKVDGLVWSLNGTLVGCGGADNQLQSYNTNPDPPKAFWLKSHKGYLFAAKSTDYQSRVWFTPPGNHTIWDAFAFIDVNKDDGGVVNGLEVVGRGQYLAVFKSTGIYAIDGDIFDPDPAIGNQSVRLVNSKGCASGYSIVKVNDDIILYLGIDGKVYSFDGVNSTPVSEEVHATITGFNSGRFQYAKAVYNPYRNEYWITFATGTGTKHDRVMAYNLITKSWFLWTPAQEQDSLALVRVASSTFDVPFILAGAADTGFIYRWDTNGSLADFTDDDATAINAYYQTAWVDLGSHVYKLLRRVYLYQKQTGNWNITLGTYSDFSSSTDTSLTASLNQTNEKDAFNQNSLGNRFAWRFTNSTINQYFEVEKMEAYWIQKGGGMWT